MASQFHAIGSCEDNSLKNVLLILQETVAAYTECGEGKLLIACTKYPNSGENNEFQISLCGLPLKAFILTEIELDKYLVKRQAQRLESQMTILSYIERCLIKILKSSGWGELSVKFKRGRKEKVVVVGEMTISDRFIITPSAV